MIKMTENEKSHMISDRPKNADRTFVLCVYGAAFLLRLMRFKIFPLFLLGSI